MRTTKLLMGICLFAVTVVLGIQTSHAAAVPYEVLTGQDMVVGKGDSVKYGSWSTSVYSVCDADGVTRMAYCVDPVRTGPAGGNKSGVTIYRYDSSSMPLAAAVYLHTAGGPLTDYSYLLPQYDATDSYKTYAYVHAAIAYALHTGFEDSETTGVDINEFKNFFDACLNDSANSGYDVKIKVYDFGGNMQRLSAAYFEEIPQTNKLYITKGDVDNEGVLLSGAVYGVYEDEACSKYITSFTSTGRNGRGVAAVAKSYDHVYIKETKAPYGYRLSNDVYEVWIADGDNETEERFDSIQKGRIILEKYDRQRGKYDASDANDIREKHIVAGGSLKDAEYELYAGEDIRHPGTGELYYAAGELISSGKTDEDGKIIFDNLWLGTYEIRENKASRGYAVNTKPIVYKMPQQNSDSPIADYLVDAPEDSIKRKVKIIKTKEGGERLAGIEFMIFKKGEEGDYTEDYALEAGPGKSKKLVTDSNGEAVTNDLEYGEYIIRELNPLPGYDNPGKIKLHIKEEGSEPMELKIVNHPHRESTPPPIPVGKLTLVKGADIYKRSNYQTSDTGEGYSVKIKQEYTVYEPANEVEVEAEATADTVGSENSNNGQTGIPPWVTATVMLSVCFICYVVFRFIRK